MSDNSTPVASITNYQGKEIYNLNYSNHKTVEDLAEAIKKARLFRKTSPKLAAMRDILMLVDLSNSFVYGEGYEELKRSGKELKPITKKRAVVGLNTAKKIMLNAYNRFLNADFRAFDSTEEAKRWLVS